MIKLLNFQKWMSVCGFDLAFLANIKIWANNTLVPNSSDRECSTLVTCNALVNYWRIILFFNFRLLLFHFLFNRFFKYLGFSNFILCDNLLFNLGNQFGHKFTKFLINGVINAFYFWNIVQWRLMDYFWSLCF